MDEITQTKSKARIWQEQVEAQVRSGKTVRAFCEEHQLKRHTFFYWRKKFQALSNKGLEIGRLPSRFIPITGALPWAGKSPCIHLPNGVKIDLGASLESGAVSQFIRSLCGVVYPPKDGHSAKS